MASPFSDEIHDTADRIVRRYPVARSALLPLLHLVQSEQNHVTDEGITFCAEKVGLTRAEVGAVATFYTMYKREPVGDWLLSVCTNPVCKQAGGGQIYENYQTALGGHSDPETKVTVEHAECLGICDGAPVVQVNYEMFGPMTVEEGDQLLASCRAGDPPVSPWSGEKPPTFAEVHRDLSGVNDAWEDQLHRAALQQIAYDKPPTYRTGETDLPVTFPGGDPAGIGGAAFREAAAGTVAAPPAPQTTTGTPDVEPPATLEAPVAGADESGTPSGTVDHPPPAGDAAHAGEGDPAAAEPETAAQDTDADAGAQDTDADAGAQDTDADAGAQGTNADAGAQDTDETQEDR